MINNILRGNSIYLYTAPEVLQKQPFDYRIDIYSLAITAFAILTGKTP